MDQNYRNPEDFLCDESFQRYCLGTDPSATDSWEKWIAAHPEASADIAEAKQIFAILNANQGNLAEQVSQLRDGMERSSLLKEALETTPAPSRRVRYISIAATLLVLISGTLIWKYTTKKNALPELAATIQSGKEPRKTLVLSDGSVLTMRNNSTISLSEGFGTKNRVLTLSGEAFFDVKPDPTHPFIVHTKEATIEVMGTVFNVSAYPENVYTETALFRGKVSVTSKTDARKTILTPNQKLVVYAGKARDTTSMVRALAVDPADHKAKEIAWVRSRLKIQDESLEKIAIRLQEWYGIEIVITDEDVKQYSYSGTFESETVIKALEALQLSYPFSISMEQNRIVISK